MSGLEAILAPFNFHFFRWLTNFFLLWVENEVPTH